MCASIGAQARRTYWPQPGGVARRGSATVAPRSGRLGGRAPGILALTAVLLLAGCSAGGGTGAATPTPAPSASTLASTAPTAGPSPATCKLPVASGDAPTDGNPAHGATGNGGFLTMPGGTFATDPGSLAAYDFAVGKWLAVPRAWISPDGTHYAWPEYRSVGGPATGIIHVVEIATGADKSFNVPAPSMPVSYEAAGVFITRVVPASDAPPQGLSMVDPSTGAFKQFIADGSWTALGGGFAFGGDIDTGVAPPPPASGPGQLYNRVRKIELATGAVTPVTSYPGSSVRVLGVRGTTPIVSVLTAAGHRQIQVPAVIYDQVAGPDEPTEPIVVDAAAVWFSGHKAVYRWDGSGPLGAAIPVAPQLAIPAGACR